MNLNFLENDILDFNNVSKIIKTGKIISVNGTTIKANIPNPKLGEIYLIEDSKISIPAKITAFNEQEAYLSPMAEVHNLSACSKLKQLNSHNNIKISMQYCGNIINALGQILTDHSVSTPQNSLCFSEVSGPLFTLPKPLLERRPITKPLFTGIKSIDSFITIGKGQRLIALAEPGVGKSTLLLNLAENSTCDLVIMALIGERGREVTELYDNLKTSTALSKTIIVASTSDEPATMRAEAANTAMRLAELAADQGLEVLLAFDSLTRYLRSLRDIGLSSGEIPIRRGYPASVFEQIPKLIERAGTFNSGSITGIFTMLSSGEIDEDPFVEEVKGLTDGHIILSRRLAELNHFPAIDISKSLSRLHHRFWDQEMLEKINHIKSTYNESLEERDLLLVSQNMSEFEKMKSKISLIEKFLKQDKENVNIAQLHDLINELHQMLSNQSPLM